MTAEFLFAFFLVAFICVGLVVLSFVHYRHRYKTNRPEFMWSEYRAHERSLAIIYGIQAVLTGLAVVVCIVFHAHIAFDEHYVTTLCMALMFVIVNVGTIAVNIATAAQMSYITSRPHSETV